jgi:hypothetical protein
VAIENFQFRNAEEEGRRTNGKKEKERKGKKEGMGEIPMQVLESQTFS